MKKIPFYSLIILMVCLALATLMEHSYSRLFVLERIYRSVWFMGLWGVLCVSILFVLIQGKRVKLKADFFLHLSFIILFLGGLLTATTSERGFLHLRVGETTTEFVDDLDEYANVLPFALTLERFNVEYHTGTDAPSDYISHLKVTTEDSLVRKTVSMNKVLSIKGYRLYQMSFDEDRKGTFISVNHDRFGRSVSYVGFLLFGCAFLWFLFGRHSRFRTLLNDPLLKRAGLCLVLAALPVLSSASPSTVSKEQAIRFCELQVMYNNRVAPLQTLAHDFTMKLTGKASHGEFTAEQVFVGWLLYPQEWRNESMIRIKNKELRQILSIDRYASYNDLFYKDGTSVLSSLWPEPFRVGPKNALMKTVAEVDEKTQLLVRIQNGSILTLFPHENKDGFRWLSPSGELPVTISGGDSLLIRHSLARLKEAVQKKDNEAFMEVIDTIESYQQAEGGVYLLSKQKVTAEWWYNVLNFSVWGYRFNLLVGLLSLVWFIGCLLKKNKGAIFFNRFLVVMLGGSFLFLSSGILLRTYVSGRFPLGNGYETMMFVAWCILLLTLFLRAKVPLMISFGFLFSGFALLVSSLGQMNPQITPLEPILDSTWLNIHVSVLMMSYALFGFLMLNGLAVLLLIGVRRNRDEQIGRLTVLSRLLLYPAVFLLGIGIVFGAVWANESCGSYWSWDPKEAWALITFLVYCLPFHEQGLSFFRRPLFFHIYLIVAFGVVLMTYFEVNVVLGGMSGYGQ